MIQLQRWKAFMRNLFKTLLVILCILPLISLAAAVLQQKTITIGVLYNLTGDQAPLDKASLRGAELAAAEINAQGGIHGNQLVLQIRNGATQPKLLKREAAAFAQNKHIQIVMGLSDNNMVLAAAPAIVKAKKVFITSGATAPSLIRLIPHYLYLVAFGDNAQAAAAAEFAFYQLHLKKAVVIYDRSMEYTRTLASYFTTAFVRAATVFEIIFTIFF